MSYILVFATNTRFFQIQFSFMVLLPNKIEVSLQRTLVGCIFKNIDSGFVVAYSLKCRTTIMKTQLYFQLTKSLRR